jgi:transcriptional regulator with XRE-family HTH domain
VVMHVGSLIRRLRDERGLTQAELARRAGVSELTIRNGEAAAVGAWRRTTATDVFLALDEALPISAADAGAYLGAMGISAALLESIRSAIPASVRAEAEAERAGRLAASLARAVGAARVLGVLEGLAAAWGVALAVEAAGSSRSVRTTEQIGGVTYEIISPVPPPVSGADAARGREPGRARGGGGGGGGVAGGGGR